MTTVGSRSTVTLGLQELRLRREKIGFWMHFSAYAFVNALIAAMNLAYSPGTIWFIFVLFPWGIGVVAHFLGAYYLAPIRAREKELEAAQGPELRPVPR